MLPGGADEVGENGGRDEGLRLGETDGRGEGARAGDFAAKAARIEAASCGGEECVEVAST